MPDFKRINTRSFNRFSHNPRSEINRRNVFKGTAIVANSCSYTTDYYHITHLTTLLLITQRIFTGLHN
jgi:hypothetical protein